MTIVEIGVFGGFGSGFVCALKFENLPLALGIIEQKSWHET